MLRTKLLVTDDSFEFNRVLGRLKAMVAALPVVSPDDERELQVGLDIRAGQPRCRPDSHRTLARKWRQPCTLLNMSHMRQFPG